MKNFPLSVRTGLETTVIPPFHEKLTLTADALKIQRMIEVRPIFVSNLAKNFRPRKIQSRMRITNRKRQLSSKFIASYISITLCRVSKTGCTNPPQRRGGFCICNAPAEVDSKVGRNRRRCVSLK